ncbi:D-galactarate dehydratase [Klebsiella pneumoniae]|uniref:D-galactarate dehydratase n=1 Tax=Klebsiella pneumoniae TaxID=573 RepID=A0A2X3EQ42_KLEPN|nr:D-galactarate dehydratase [Klebsiella pneumoniae]
MDSASIVSLQDEKHVGFKSMVDDILQVAERHLAKLNQRQRETCPASELVVGMQCGGSDAFSGVTANPAVGLRVRPAGALRRDGDVLRSDRSTRRHSSVDAAGD